MKNYFESVVQTDVSRKGIRLVLVNKGMWNNCRLMDSERQTDAGALDDNKLMNMVRDSGNGLGSDSRHGSPFISVLDIKQDYGRTYKNL